MAILAGEKNVTTAGTAEALAASTTATSVVVQAKRTNTGSAYVGNSAAQHLELLPGESVAIDLTDLANVFIDVDTNGEGVNYLGTDS